VLGPPGECALPLVVGAPVALPSGSDPPLPCVAVPAGSVEPDLPPHAPAAAASAITATIVIARCFIAGPP
jgi:hypothetical protein